MKINNFMEKKKDKIEENIREACLKGMTSRSIKVIRQGRWQQITTTVQQKMVTE
jgi:hypothetical protein